MMKTKKKTTTNNNKNKDKTKKERFTLNILKPGQRMTIFGMTQTGKTFLADKLMKNLAKIMLIVVLDVKDEYDLPTLPFNKLKNKNSKGCYRINRIEYNDYEIKGFLSILEFLSENMFNRRNCFLVVDEIGRVVPKHGMLYDVAPNFGTYLLQGALRKCGLIAISQRPAQVHLSIPSESEHVLSFYVHGERDLLAIKNWFPIKSIQKLDEYEFMRFTVPRQLITHYKYYKTKKID
ncbi:hypothetical protein ES702_06194 [subsurface metagenome]